jgi:glycolate oxidase FAD binding subunit
VIDTHTPDWDAIRPSQNFSPRDADELAQVLAQCNAEKRAVVPWGGGTLQHLGNPPARFDTVIQTRMLDQVIEYAFDDLTITVGAGMTLAEINRVLGEHGQFLPLDLPYPARATIGGALAANANGPLRLRYGPARDYMLGLKFATVDGQIIKAGSKVVKNVAGYELHKVQIGALGTIGILTQATFKVFPKPPAEATLVAAFDALPGACAAVPAIWNLNTPPIALELLDMANAQHILPGAQGNWFVIARFSGTKATMAVAGDLSTQSARDHGARAADALNDGTAVWQSIADLPATLRKTSPDALCVRLSVPPGELQNALRLAADTAIAQNMAPPCFFAHAANASVYASVQGDPTALGQFVMQLRPALHKLHGHLVLESAPPALRKNVSAWDEVGATFKLMQSIKRKFDPNNILNPGRFVGGI